MRGVAAVVGVGKGIGGSVAKLLAKSGFKVAIFARNQNYKGADKLTPLADEIRASGGVAIPLLMDAADPASVTAAFAQLRAACPGEDVSLLVYNAGARDLAPVPLEDTPADKFLSYWKTNCFGAFLTTQQVLPAMKRAQRGTVIYTGATAALRGLPGMSSFAVGKHGLRALSQSVAAEAAPFHVHVCHVIVDGPVDIPLIRKAVGPAAALMNPDDIARVYLALHEQTDQSVWSTELTIVPHAKL